MRQEPNVFQMMKSNLFMHIMVIFRKGEIITIRCVLMNSWSFGGKFDLNQ